MAIDMTTTGIQNPGDGDTHISSKAWAFYNTVSTYGIRNGTGFSGITDRGAGYASLEFTVDQAKVNWAMGCAAGDNCRNNIDGNAHLVGAVHMISHTGGTNSAVDCHRNFITIHGT